MHEMRFPEEMLVIPKGVGSPRFLQRASSPEGPRVFFFGGTLSYKTDKNARSLAATPPLHPITRKPRVLGTPALKKARLR